MANPLYIKLCTKIYVLSNCDSTLLIVQDALSKLNKKLFNDRTLIKNCSKFQSFFLATNIIDFFSVA